MVRYRRLPGRLPLTVFAHRPQPTVYARHQEIHTSRLQPVRHPRRGSHDARGAREVRRQAHAQGLCSQRRAAAAGKVETHDPRQLRRSLHRVEIACADARVEQEQQSGIVTARQPRDNVPFRHGASLAESRRRRIDGARRLRGVLFSYRTSRLRWDVSRPSHPPMQARRGESRRDVCST
jgi:hypothetical protein